MGSYLCCANDKIGVNYITNIEVKNINYKLNTPTPYYMSSNSHLEDVNKS